VVVVVRSVVVVTVGGASPPQLATKPVAPSSKDASSHRRMSLRAFIASVR
jgi:hypothetical protein